MLKIIIDTWLIVLFFIFYFYFFNFYLHILSVFWFWISLLIYLKISYLFLTYSFPLNCCNHLLLDFICNTICLFYNTTSFDLFYRWLWSRLFLLIMFEITFLSSYQVLHYFILHNFIFHYFLFIFFTLYLLGFSGDSNVSSEHADWRMEWRRCWANPLTSLHLEHFVRRVSKSSKLNSL